MKKAENILNDTILLLKTYKVLAENWTKTPLSFALQIGLSAAKVIERAGYILGDSKRLSIEHRRLKKKKQTDKNRVANNMETLKNEYTEKIKSPRFLGLSDQGDI